MKYPGHFPISLSCQLGMGSGEESSLIDQHIERLGSVGVQVLGQWPNNDGTITVQELYRISWPVQILFPTWVVGLHQQPMTVWVEHIAPQVTETAGAFVGGLHLFETQAYATKKPIPRYEQNTTVWAQHCLDERGWGLSLMLAAKPPAKFPAVRQNS